MIFVVFFILRHFYLVAEITVWNYFNDIRHIHVYRSIILSYKSCCILRVKNFVNVYNFFIFEKFGKFLTKWAPFDHHRTKTRLCGLIWSLQRNFGKFHFWTFLFWIWRIAQKWNYLKFLSKLQIKPQKRVFVLWWSYRDHFIRNFPNFSKVKK